VGRTLVVTNDFPTRQGGIESFVLALASRLPSDEVVVYTARMPGDTALDATLPFPVVRDHATTLLPTRGVSRAAAALLRSHRCDRVLFGAAAPLGLLAGALRAAGARRIVAITHGHECWWARVPGTRHALARIGDDVDVLTYLGSYTRQVISSALSATAAARMQRLTPGVDPKVFHPGAGGAEVRRRHGLRPGQPVLGCIARLTPRKGQDQLVRAMPAILSEVPDAHLLVVGGGGYGHTLAALARKVGVAQHVRFVGPVRWADTPPYFDAVDVFAMPCRTRRGGLEPEALGIVFLEAAATGVPVLVGASGGAPDTVRHGQTGYVVDPRSPAEIAARAVELLRDPTRARAMGAAGRRWAQEDWTWDQSAARLRSLLD
jgi:phosphatidylinositol alpha-1,6-mannosyltransferase